MITKETTLARPDKHQLRVWIHQPEGSCRAVVVLVHGMGEHAGRYQHVAQQFTNQHIALLTYDQRGHGFSSGKRGHADFYQMLEDVGEMLKLAKESFPEKPIILYGHSMGGSVALYALLEHPDYQENVSGLVLGSPWFRLSKQPVRPVVALARMLSKVAPQITLSSNIDPALLSSDAAVGEAYSKDPLVHRRISVGLFSQINQAGSEAVDRVGELKIPLLIIHGSDDKITCHKTSKRLAKAAGSKAVYREWGELQHELHNEPEGAEVVSYVLAWIAGVVRPA